jgi:paraquat-inducible protein A
MLDVFVVALLTAVVQLGRFASVAPGPAVLPFAGVVVLTMLASASFDPRAIWDQGLRGGLRE